MSSWWVFALRNRAFGFCSNELGFSYCLKFQILVLGRCCIYFAVTLYYFQAAHKSYEDLFSSSFGRETPVGLCVLSCVCSSLCRQPGLLGAPQPLPTLRGKGLSLEPLGASLGAFEPSLWCPSRNKPEGQL